MKKQEIALEIAKKSILAKLNNQNYKPTAEEKLLLSESSGVFVTLRKNKELRGCIGIFESDLTLAENIAELAVSAAFHDPRFLPLTKKEWPEIKIEISILSPTKKISSIEDIVLEKHGIIIENNNNKGVYLPQVAVETGWDKITLLNNLCIEKADLPAYCWNDINTSIYVFSVEVIEEK